MVSGVRCGPSAETCQIPDDLRFQTKPHQAAEMLRAISQQGMLPFKSIVADTVYGNNLEFLEAAEQCIGTTYFVAVRLISATALEIRGASDLIFSVRSERLSA